MLLRVNNVELLESAPQYCKTKHNLTVSILYRVSKYKNIIHDLCKKNIHEIITENYNKLPNMYNMCMIIKLKNIVIFENPNWNARLNNCNTVITYFEVRSLINISYSLPTILHLIFYLLSAFNIVLERTK